MNYWVVGADWDGVDKTEEFIEQGLWQNGYTDKFLQTVNQVQVGDKIAIKAIYGQKHNLPFNNFGCFVSCMKIKAIGVVVENLQDGKTIKVNWDTSKKEKIIYLSTYWKTIARVINIEPRNWIFEDVVQPISILEEFYKKRANPKVDELSDEFILNQFQNTPSFHLIESNPESRQLFIDLAKYIHQVPLDWWSISSNKKTPLRFGYNHNYGKGISGFVCQVGFDEQGIFLVINENSLDVLGDEDEEIRLTPEVIAKLRDVEFRGFMVDRVGCWPNDYLHTPVTVDFKHLANGEIAKNQILFGPAGTGKTYRTINLALEILDPKQDYSSLSRAQIKKRFDHYTNTGRVQFVTFHQSFSYEDFVEGIQAKTDQAGQIEYRVEPGIFKQFCQTAQEYNHFSTLSNGEKINGYDVFAVNADSVDLKKPNGNIISFSKNLLLELIAALRNKSITIDDIKQKKAIEKLSSIAEVNHLFLEPFIVNGYNNILSQLLDTITTRGMAHEAVEVPYVLIIDEINRGNISRIFGELITLIEESKREGAEESLSVVLPYSKEVFSVPNNVFIIGTMNSSDRSLTGLDVALRRRFTFIEMQPDCQQLSGIDIDGINIELLLTTINKRIELLLDRDHCIGHAYFMPLKNHNKQTIKELGLIFKQKIIPLLQEYFYDDWERIDWVLGSNGMLVKQFKHKSEMEKLLPKAALDRVQNHCWQLNPDAKFDSDVELYLSIINIRDYQ